MKLKLSILISLLSVSLISGCTYHHTCPTQSCIARRSSDLSQHPQTYPDSSNKHPSEFFYK